MTLVVARSSGDFVRVVSDLRVTDAHDIRRGYPFGVLKVVTLGPRLCVAFAGPVDPAIDAVRLIASEASSFDEALLGLEARSGSPDGPQFLIVGSAPGRIARVRMGVVEDPMTTGWIGDIDAFNEFQRQWAQVDLPRVARLEPHDALSARMMMAFNGLIGGTVASVGEAMVAGGIVLGRSPPLSTSRRGERATSVNTVGSANADAFRNGGRGWARLLDPNPDTARAGSNRNSLLSGEGRPPLSPTPRSLPNPVPRRQSRPVPSTRPS